MKRKLITGIYIILIVLISIASTLILRHTVQPTNVTSHSPLDSYVIGATLSEYDKTGQIKSRMTADTIDYFDSHGHSTTLFIKPFMITYSDDRTPWHIHADEATVDKAGDKVFMKGHVIFHALPTTNHTETTITTTALTLYPKKSLAITNEPVILTRSGAVIHGKGLIANLKTNQYQLQSESEAVYTPKSP